MDFKWELTAVTASARYYLVYGRRPLCAPDVRIRSVAVECEEAVVLKDGVAAEPV